jgi:hypothetical protein
MTRTAAFLRFTVTRIAVAELDLEDIGAPKKPLHRQILDLIRSNMLKFPTMI